MPTLNQIIFADERLDCCAMLDADACPDLLDHLYDEESDIEFDCLYPGELEPALAYMAPYLAPLPEGTPFTDWVLSGFGQHWGIIILLPKVYDTYFERDADLDLSAVRRQFRKFNIRGQGDDRRYFRYFDPRVLRVIIYAFSKKQLEIFFGHVSYLLMESTTPGNVLRLSRGNLGELVSEEITISS